ncbi:MAG TPA: MFS transporter [Spirochaetia bacterium]|nr:MFS transporter [Spirochaetia bacterium]
MMHKRNRDVRIDRQIKNSLRFSILDAASFSVMLGAAESYFQAFAIFLKGTLFQVGYVYSIPMCLGAVMQLFSSSALRLFRSRKRLTVAAGLLRSLLLVALFFVFYMGEARVWILLLIISLYFALNYLPAPVWTSWMRDLVDDSKRGAYFSRRNRMANLIALFAVVIAGLILEANRGETLTGFTIIFAIALAGSLGSSVFLSLKYDIPYAQSRKSREGLFRYSARRLFRTNYGKFVLYNFVLHFGVFLSGPFFVPFMLDTLKMSYLNFMIATALTVLVKFVTMPLWGAMSDQYGNRKLLIVASLFISILPLTWLLGHPFWWICLIQGFSGLAWAGFDITALNFAYDVVPQGKLTRYTSYLIFYRGIATFLGGVAGGFIMHHFVFLGSAFYGIFLLSGLVRLLLALPLLFLLKEVRKVEHISYKNLMFKVLSIGPRRGLQMLLIGRVNEKNRDTEQEDESGPENGTVPENGIVPVDGTGIGPT